MPPVRGDDDGTTGYAVYGFSRRGGYSLVGDSDSNYAVYGTSISNYAVYGASFGRSGVVGESYSGSSGVRGYSSQGIGVYGDTYRGTGVVGISDLSYGVVGSGLNNGDGVRGYSQNGNGVWGQSGYGDGVQGYTYSFGKSGVYGRSTYGYGVYGHSDNYYGVYAFSHSLDHYALYAGSSFGYAALLDGDVNVRGHLIKAGGQFKIDHPLDPANKYLSHSFVESPDMKNVYDGVVVLDDKGEAEIELPDWFGALNKEFRYQLTAIGAPAPNLYIAEEISDGVTNYSNNSRFKVAGGISGMKVSWQVTGIRKDPYANAHRIPVEEDKPAKERGYYTYPELYGQPEERGIISRLLVPKIERKSCRSS
jgi:hypothetical protein